MKTLEALIDKASSVFIVKFTDNIAGNPCHLGCLRIRVWHDLQFRAAALHSMSIVLVERFNEENSVRVVKPMWLAWVGEQMPSLDEVYMLYLRRFTVDQRQ